MRFYHSLTLSTLILIYLLSDNVLGASTKGRYIFLKCRPDSKNANCIEKKSPLIDLHGKASRISPGFIKDVYPKESSEESPETEESGDGSGDNNLPDFIQKTHNSGAEEQIQYELDGSGDNSNDISPIFTNPNYEKPKLSEEDLREDNMIE